MEIIEVNFRNPRKFSRSDWKGLNEEEKRSIENYFKTQVEMLEIIYSKWKK